ncbi:MAG: hypothetical protein KME52_31525 [Desmonostoc geniculatum HA4340-LM1]|jgi:hypothetical protein|nr:hypothetical protein [Desmonostoc geniculatum HA4340-LM1]
MKRFASIFLTGLIASASALAISPKADASSLAELDSYHYNDGGNYELQSRHYRNGDRDRDFRNIRDDYRRHDRDRRRHDRDNDRRYDRDNDRRYRDRYFRNIRDNRRRYERDRDWGRG